MKHNETTGINNAELTLRCKIFQSSMHVCALETFLDLCKYLAQQSCQRFKN